MTTNDYAVHYYYNAHLTRISSNLAYFKNVQERQTILVLQQPERTKVAEVTTEL